MSKITTNYLRLDFYAARHNLPVKDLSWAILEISDDCECWRHIALKIKGREAYIDVTEDKYIRFNTFLNFREYEFLDAELRGYKLIHEARGEAFLGGGYTLTIDMKKEVGYFYKLRVFDSPNFKPYKLNLEKSINDNLAAFFEEERAFEFLANRFWITKEQLSWGVLEETSNSSGRTWIYPVLRVGSTRDLIYLYFDNALGNSYGGCGITKTTYLAYLEDGKLYYEKEKGEGFIHSVALDFETISDMMFYNYLFLREE